MSVVPLWFDEQMDEDTLNRTVAGESLRDLIPALQEVVKDAQVDEDGMWSGAFALEPETGTPFMRALMRIEAELLLEDADRLGEAVGEERTPDQRRADALLALTLRMSDALP